jgi:hypothetical protein
MRRRSPSWVLGKTPIASKNTVPRTQIETTKLKMKRPRARMWFGVSRWISSRQIPRWPFNRTDLPPRDEFRWKLRSRDSLGSPLIENSQVIGLSPKMSQSRFPKLSFCGRRSLLLARLNPMEFPIGKNKCSVINRIKYLFE